MHQLMKCSSALSPVSRLSSVLARCRRHWGLRGRGDIQIHFHLKHPWSENWGKLGVQLYQKDGQKISC